MDHTNGISLKTIFLDNGNWWKFSCPHAGKLRPAIIKNVLKMLACQTALLGYHTYTCPTCGFQKRLTTLVNQYSAPRAERRQLING